MNVSSFTTDRRQGDARAAGALERLLRRRGWPATVATAEQVHGHQIVVVPALTHSRKFPGADGLLTAIPNQPLAIFTADCASIFLADRNERVVGVLHAGWRGARAGILGKAVRLIRRQWGIPAKQLRVWFGPSIGPCCFEVQWDVARYFPKTRRRAGDRWTVDLARELHAQARRLGIQFLTTKVTCTMHNRWFYSYRWDQTHKRMASIIIKKP